MGIKLVLFDAGGTLTKVLPEREERLQKACQYFNLNPIPDWETARSGLRTVDRFFIGAIQEGRMIDRETVREAVRLMLAEMEVTGRLDDPALLWDFVETQYETEVLMDDALETLTALKSQGLMLAVASNATPNYETTLHSLGIAQIVDAIFLSDIVGYAKPDPKFFLFILEQTKMTPVETVHVGNSYWHDIIGARRASILPVYFDRRNVLPDADCPRITHLSDLPDLLKHIPEGLKSWF
ncbi:MAG: HAD family hydrolase [Candidatus Fervidibacter sp.]|uniref:HAD family hydrolase n=1 Tax=Candidatus Fervidibacter sp. TaxID=3100871 RepID=UPI0040498CB2